jgi:hypothetical protein
LKRKQKAGARNVLVFLLCLVLIITCFTLLHPLSAMLALIGIVVGGLALASGRLTLRRIAVLSAMLVLAAVANWAEGFLEGRANARAAEAVRQQAAAAAAEQQRREADFNSLSPAQHLEQAKLLLRVDDQHPTAKEADLGLKHIAAIPKNSALYSQGKATQQQFEVAAHRKEEQNARKRVEDARKQAKDEAQAKRILRDAMAKTLENKMLDEGYNVDVNAIGADHTTLRIKWILVSKAMAHNLSKQGDFFDNARKVGFRRVEITDGYEQTWYWKLD